MKWLQRGRPVETQPIATARIAPMDTPTTPPRQPSPAALEYFRQKAHIDRHVQLLGEQGRAGDVSSRFIELQYAGDNLCAPIVHLESLHAAHPYKNQLRLGGVLTHYLISQTFALVNHQQSMNGIRNAIDKNMSDEYRLPFFVSDQMQILDKRLPALSEGIDKMVEFKGDEALFFYAGSVIATWSRLPGYFEYAMGQWNHMIDARAKQYQQQRQTL